MGSIMRLNIKLLVSFRILIFHIFFIFPLHFMDFLYRSCRALIYSTHWRPSSSLLLCRSVMPRRSDTSMWWLRPQVLRARADPLLDGLAEHLLLPPYEFLPLPSLSLPYLLKFDEFCHFLFGFFFLLMCQTSLPLLFLDLNIDGTVSIFLLLEMFKI